MAFPGQRPPLTPVLLAGLAARPVPPAVLQPLLDLAMAAVVRCHGEVFARLERAGKEVVHSALTLVMSERERRDLAALAAAESLFVEANDLAGAALLAGRAHALGPFVNVYNEGTLAYLAKRGAVRVTDPLRAE